jgi:hypothetical protein
VADEAESWVGEAALSEGQGQPEQKEMMYDISGENADFYQYISWRASGLIKILLLKVLVAVSRSISKPKTSNRETGKEREREREEGEENSPDLS